MIACSLIMILFCGYGGYWIYYRCTATFIHCIACMHGVHAPWLLLAHVMHTVNYYWIYWYLSLWSSQYIHGLVSVFRWHQASVTQSNLCPITWTTFCINALSLPRAGCIMMSYKNSNPYKTLWCTCTRAWHTYLHVFRINCDHRRLMDEKYHKSWTAYLVVPVLQDLQCSSMKKTVTAASN